jgi:replicative DNA helicase
LLAAAPQLRRSALPVSAVPSSLKESSFKPQLVVALKHKVVVLAAAQLNREAVKDEEPQLHHLRDSGSLEQDADRVLMMKLEKEDDAERYAVVKIFQRKHRNGAQGMVRINFDRWTTRCANYAA